MKQHDALATDRHNARQRQRRRARSLLDNLTRELSENYDTLRAVKAAYETTDWGKSFYLSTVTWETALAAGDVRDILGSDLTERLATQYGWLSRIRYHVDLLTRLWMAPRDVIGYGEIQQGFRQAILAAMDHAMSGHQELMRRIAGNGLGAR